MIRIGRRVYGRNGPIDPSYGNFTPIVIANDFSELTPWNLKDDHGRIMENIWQFSKIYKAVPAIRQMYSQEDSELVWEHPSEIHVKDGKPTLAYYHWREKGINWDKPVSHPVGQHMANKYAQVILRYKDESYEIMNKVAGIRRLFIPLYCGLVKETDAFKDLQDRLIAGENLLLIVKDGPHLESENYYKSKYKIKDLLQNETMLVTKDHIRMMINDTRHVFGYGYCLAMALLGVDEKWNNYKYESIFTLAGTKKEKKKERKVVPVRENLIQYVDKIIKKD